MTEPSTALSVLALVLGHRAGGCRRTLRAIADTTAVVEPVEKTAPLVIAARRPGQRRPCAHCSAAHPAADVNQRTADGTSALHWAVYHGDADLVRQLLAAGADANARNDYGSTPMSEAAIRGDLKILGALLAAHADVDSANADGQTALMILSRTSNVAAAELLIAHGAQVNAREKWRDQTRAHVGRGRSATGDGAAC